MLIQKLRLQHGWSQQQLAELSGLSTRTIQRLENGQPASVESLKALAAVFEVDFHLLKGDCTMPAFPLDSASLAPTHTAPAPTTPSAASTSASFAPADIAAERPTTTAEHTTAIPTAVASREEEEAFAHVRKLQSFYRGVLVYLIVIAALAAINFWTDRSYPWVLWVALGWGLGLCIRALKVFDLLPFGPRWERRQVEKRLGRPL